MRKTKFWTPRRTFAANERAWTCGERAWTCGERHVRRERRGERGERGERVRGELDVRGERDVRRVTSGERAADARFTFGQRRWRRTSAVRGGRPHVRGRTFAANAAHPAHVRRVTFAVANERTPPRTKKFAANRSPRTWRTPRTSATFAANAAHLGRGR